MTLLSDPNTLILMLLCVIVLVLAGMVLYLSIKVKKLLRGKNAESLEDTIVNLSKHVDSLEQFTKGVHEQNKDIQKKIATSARGVETVRFNAFRNEGLGGNQSFATAILNDNGKGVVISSIYSRERVSVFAKPISEFKSEYELSNEEQEAITKSKESLKK